MKLRTNRRIAWRERLSSGNRDQFTCVAEFGSQLAGFVCVYGNENSHWGLYIGDSRFNSPLPALPASTRHRNSLARLA